MEIHVDLFGCKDSEDVQLRFGEIFQFGGPKGNIAAKADVMDIGWGINWDAFIDCLRDLEVGGIWGSAKKVVFPLKIKILNYQEFLALDTKGFQIFKLPTPKGVGFPR
ncbi:MAG: barstar family protein [Candidatus Micrarchaeota archaeon]